MNDAWLQGISDRLVAIRDALWDLQPAGSAKNTSRAYVRGLRDRAAVELMARSRDGAIQEAHSVLEHNGGSVTLGDVLAEWAKEDANALVKALGYEVPEKEG